MLSIIRYYVPNSFENYNHLLTNGQQAACIDPYDWSLALAEAQKAQVEITEIWLTHGHGDHIRGVPKAFDGIVRGHASLAPNIALTHTISDTTEFKFGGQTICALATPGHTLDHICYFVPGIPALIAGDTLFNAGVGNTRSGDTELLFHSIEQLKTLPAATQLYNGHDYMANNLRFSEHLVGASAATQHWLTLCETSTVDDRPITTLADEADINLFFQCHETHLQRKLHLPSNSDALTVFKHIRAARDQW